MKGIELVRWGVPVLGFPAYVKWGGVSLALAFAGILFAVMSGLIHWRRTSPSSFFGYIRVIVVLFVLLPAIGATLVGAFSGMLGLMLALPLLAGAILLTRWAYRNVAKAPVDGLPSMASQNLFAANALTDNIQGNNRRSHTRGALLHTQSENLELDRRNRELEEQKAALERRIQSLEREAALPPDPFADPIPPSRS
ncbi:MAG: hypothetical protein EOP84_06415 [Verrucomicrobiaceae bacterium]|nr:MAG: hypothetical protein EOP84_06415 [Verrucomicrobiaceae bacterium]